MIMIVMFSNTYCYPYKHNVSKYNFLEYNTYVLYIHQLCMHCTLFYCSSLQSILRQDGLPEEAGASYKHICIKDTPYLMLLRGNSHQGMWILTRWQLQMLDQKCNFLQERGGLVVTLLIFICMDVCLFSRCMQCIYPFV